MSKEFIGGSGRGFEGDCACRGDFDDADGQWGGGIAIEGVPASKTDNGENEEEEGERERAFSFDHISLIINLFPIVGK